ncbi:MAG: hypothetical protein CM15mP46_7300 [Alphaproteobacteria bacterium]|nr:MAG: hypothetical protein CM15mP46_7300 [Alphaproteobacteria bacterium]
MIEHDMEFISRLCDPVIVMAEGQVLATDTAESVKNNDAVIEAHGTGAEKPLMDRVMTALIDRQ